MVAAMAQTCRAGERDYLGNDVWRDITPYNCGCAACAAFCEDEARSEFLAEQGASYYYSGMSASDAMQMARHDIEARKLPTVEQLRAEYRRLRREAGTAPEASRALYAEEMIALLRNVAYLHQDHWGAREQARAEQIVGRDIYIAVKLLGGGA
jgi:hypothetical protein